VTEKKTPSIELKAIMRRERSVDIPPPPSGATLREWFTGLVITNDTLMRDIDPKHRVVEAVRIAGELVSALNVQRMPSRESMAPVSEKEMQAWDEKLARENNQKRVTLPSFSRTKRTTTKAGLATIVPPKPETSPGRYVVIEQCDDLLSVGERNQETVQTGRPGRGSR
jgi:hypothetical protein